MSKKSLWFCVLTILVAAWLVFGITYAYSRDVDSRISGVDIVLTDSDSRFLSRADIVSAFALEPDSVIGLPVRDFNLYELERALNASDQIEHANANLLTDGTLRITVTPMQPVARVFEHGKPSYYINSSGKKISATLRHHLDVPVLMGYFDSVHPAHNLLPLLDYIASDRLASALVSTVTQQRDGNIIIVPTIVGHVISFGDTSLIEDKFHRLATFYRSVAPVKGWNYYDTVAVRWRGQIVATRRNHAPAHTILPTVEEQFGTLDETDVETISTVENAPDDSPQN